MNINPYAYPGITAEVTPGISEKAKLQMAIEVACEKFRITRSQLTSKNRKTHLVKCRAFVMCWAVTNIKMSITKIGKTLDRDHATVIHNTNKLKEQLAIYADLNREYAEFVIELENRLL